MKILDLEQSGEEWLAWRKTIISSTDSAVILRKSEFCSPRLLWERKMGLTEPEPENEKMRRGRELEAPARELLIKQTGLNFKPACVEHSDYSWLGTSLDGLSDCKRFLCEIKCGSADLHNFALEGGIYSYYEWQICHHFLVTGCEKCYFASYRPEHDTKLALIEVVPDLDKMRMLFESERIFYEVNMKQFIAPSEETFYLQQKENKK